MPTITVSEVSGSSDGYVFCSDAVWANAHSGAGSRTAMPGTVNNFAEIGTSLSGGLYYVNRAFVSFPVVTIPAGNTITAATITITPKLPALTNPTNMAKIVQWTKTGASANLATTAFLETGNDCSSTFSMFDVMGAATGYDVSLNSVGISQIQTSGSDPSRFALISQGDWMNAQPTIPDNGTDLLITTVAPAVNYVLTITYSSPPPPSFTAGSQLFYDFQRKLWFSGAYGSLQMIATDPTQGAPKIYALTQDGSLIQMLNEEQPGWAASSSNAGIGFLQTMPLNLGNMTSMKTFHGFVMVVNDVTAIVASGGVTSPWRAFLYVDNANQSTPAIPVTLTVNARPYNTMPFGTVEGGNTVNNNVGELIGYFKDPLNNFAVPQGHNAYLEVYYPVGTPVGTPTSGMGAGSVPVHLPWAVYRMDFFISQEGESEVEP